MIESFMMSVRMMILPPKDIEPNKDTHNNKTVSAISLKHSKKQYKQKSHCEEKQIVKQVFMKFFFYRKK